MTKEHVVELVKWKSNSGVSDADMVAAMNGILPDVKMLPGFGRMDLYKDKDDNWVAVYVWDSEEEAHASNDLMAEKPSFARLITLADVSSISIEILHLP